MVSKSNEIEIEEEIQAEVETKKITQQFNPNTFFYGAFSVRIKAS